MQHEQTKIKLGFFGDSYADLVWPANSKVSRTLKTWSGRLVEDLDAELVASGLGGTNQYYAIKTWNAHLTWPQGQCDYAIFTFTWRERLYHDNELTHYTMRSWSERRHDDIRKSSKIELAIQNYHDCIMSREQTDYVYELMLKEILSLPALYPDTHFIFLPNIEYARCFALKHFTRGVLINFTFESLSNNETNSPGEMPVQCGRLGHLNNHNHDAMAAVIKNIISEYDKYADKIVELPIQDFDLYKTPVFERVFLP